MTGVARVRPVPGGSRTLDNGLAVLSTVAGRDGGWTVVELAGSTGLDRTVVHRLVLSLLGARMVRRRSDGRYTVGHGVLELASSVQVDLRSAAAEVLPGLAEQLGSTTHLSVLDGDEVVSVAVHEPRGTAMHVGYRVGSRHRPDQGAAGLAILLAGPQRPGERPELVPAREVGYAVTQGEIESGAWGLAAPVGGVTPAGPVTASIGVVALHPLDESIVGPAVVEAARSITTFLAPTGSPCG